MPRIKIFTLDGIDQICENKLCSCKNRLSSKRQFSLSFSLSIPPPEKEGKTEKEKGFQKEKRQKIKKKKKTNFLRIFPVDPLHLLPQKEEKREEITKFSFSISYSLRRKEIGKREKRNKKKEKRGEKGSDFSVFSRFLNLLLLSQKRKGRRKKGENPP